MVRAPVWLLVLLTLGASTGCGPNVDLRKGLQINTVSSGWFDAGLVDGKNKLVPSVTFTLKNVSDQALPQLQVNALFRRETEKDEWGSGFLTVAGTGGLQPGATTDQLTIRSQLGYTGTEPRQDMLKNSQFVDAKVELFAKYGSAQWQRLGEYPITRQLIAK
jgi:hypothetical protein